MKKRIWSIALGLTLIMNVIMAGCGANADKKDVPGDDLISQNRITVGFSQLGAESDWRNSNTQSMQTALSAENGFDLIYKNGQQKQANQITAIRTFIQQGVDYIVLAPVTESGWDSVLEEAKDAGIPVIIVDRMVDVLDESLFSCWVGSDFELEGRKMAAWIKNYTQSIGVGSDDIHIVNIQGTIGSSAQIGRSKGLSDAVTENGWDLVACKSGDFTETKGREVMAELLNSYDNINVVYCENDNEAIGAIDAIKSAGRNPGPNIKEGDIMVVSFDGVNQKALEYAKDGTIACIAECNPMHGPRVKGLIETLEVGESPEKRNYVDERLFSNIENVNEVVVSGACYTVDSIGDSIQGLIIPESNPEEAVETSSEILLGDEQFDFYLPLLEGKKVAVFTNHTGVVGNNTDGNHHILDVLIDKGANVTCIFAPEHGFRGTADAGADVEQDIDPKTGVPILSLYKDEDVKSLNPKEMSMFDVLVVDIQDVGARFYTYYISMYYLMEACTNAGKKVIVLDRPNPNGFYVAGPILQDDFKSNVGRLPIPVVHGLTLGELARMINGEGWLSAGKNALDLTVIPCQNYHHKDLTQVIVNPSPNLKSTQAILLYPSICYFENTVVSVGRGTENPFSIFGSPYFEGEDEYKFSFVPKSMEGATSPVYEGQVCYGVSFEGKTIEELSNEHLNLSYVVDAYNTFHAKYPEESFWGKDSYDGKYWIDLLFGTDKVRKAIEEGKSADEITASFAEDEEKFKQQRKPYLLYQDIE